MTDRLLLRDEFIRSMAEKWPDLEHAKDVIPHLPGPIKEMLAEQSEEFLLGFANGVQLTIQLGIMEMYNELKLRTGGVAQDERDVLFVRLAAMIEGFCYLACAELTNRTVGDQDDES